VLLIGFNTFYFLFGHDQGIYMPLLGVLVAVCYIFAFETANLKLPNPGFLGRALTVVFGLKPIWKIIALVAMATVAFYLLEVGNKIDYLLHADLYWTSGRDLKYDNFFLDKNLPFTIFFCLSVISVVFLRTSFQRLLVLVAGFLFVLHYTSSPDLQIVRGILYFLPIFYLVALISLAELRYLNSWVLFGLVGAALLYTTAGNFSKTYFKGPNVPSEVHYIDYARAYDAIKEHCSDKILVEATPSSFIATFYDVKVDYVISSTGWIKRDDMFYFDKRTNMYRTAYNDIPVLNKFSQLKKLDGDVCLLVRYPSQRRFIHKKVLLSLKKTARPLEFEHLTLFRL
jgi:hypothetical protein